MYSPVQLLSTGASTLLLCAANGVSDLNRNCQDFMFGTKGSSPEDGP